jgi:hypothetical protein
VDRADRFYDQTSRAAGGERAANSLQRAGSSRHATTANAKVRGAIEALPLVIKWRCLRSHGRSHRRRRVFLPEGIPPFC